MLRKRRAVNAFRKLTAAETAALIERFRIPLPRVGGRQPLSRRASGALCKCPSPHPAPTEPPSCPRCGCELYLTLFRGTDRLYHTTQDRFSLVECAGCGLIRLDPLPSLEELARFYPNEYWWDADDSAADRLSELYRQLVLQDHVQFVTHGEMVPGPVLDIGCGGGSFLAALKRRGHEVIGWIRLRGRRPSRGRAMACRLLAGACRRCRSGRSRLPR